MFMFSLNIRMEKFFSPDKVMEALGKYFDSCGSAIQSVTVFTHLNGLFRMEREGLEILNRLHQKGIIINILTAHERFPGLIKIPYSDFSVKPNKSKV